MEMVPVGATDQPTQSRMNSMPVPADRIATSAPVLKAFSRKLESMLKLAAAVISHMLPMPLLVTNVANTSVELMLELKISL